MDDKQKYHLNEMIIRAMDGSISPEDFAELDRQVGSSEPVRRHYLHFIAIYISLKKTFGLFAGVEDGPSEAEVTGKVAFQQVVGQDLDDSAIRHALIEAEIKEKQDIEQAREQKNELQRGRLTREGLRRGLIKAAAIIMLCLGILWMDRALLEQSRQKNHWVIGRLTGQINTSWGDDGFCPVTDEPLWTGAYRLHSGLAQMELHNGVRLTVEGPAVFELLAEDRLSIRDGRIYTRVPSRAIGFTITTTNAQIIDLGTEFGIWADSRGTATELHVLKGKTTLISGEAGAPKASCSVDQGQARRVNRDSALPCDIKLDEQAFVRVIDEKQNRIWRSPQALDLTDIIAGGNGYKTGKRTVSLNPVNGYNDVHSNLHRRPADYYVFKSNSMIDGLFVPDGHHTQIVSSRGDVFRECPLTSGELYADLTVNPNPKDLEMSPYRKGLLEFEGRHYGIPQQPALVMHANLGITFDLDAIRAGHPGLALSQFKSRCGISDMGDNRPCNGDFWVLVDGQVRYTLKNLKEKSVLTDMAVPLNLNDRFLTLVTTDGGDENSFVDPIKRSIDCDWCVFTNPVLEIE